jgi:hypothetical protein
VEEKASVRLVVKISIALLLLVLIGRVTLVLAQKPARKPAPVKVATIAPRPEDIGTLGGIEGSRE